MSRILFHQPIHIDEIAKRFDLENTAVVTTANTYPMVKGLVLEKKKESHFKTKTDRAIKTYRSALVSEWANAREKMRVLLNKQTALKKMDYNNAQTIDRIAKVPFRFKKQFVEIADRYGLNLSIVEGIVLNNTLTVNARFDHKKNVLEINPNYLKQHGMIRLVDGGQWISETSKTFIHEFGHAFYYNSLSEEDRMKWQTLATFLQRGELTGDMSQYIVGEKKRSDGTISYSPYYTLKDEQFVSVYARFNIKEDFAESFLYYKVEPEFLKKQCPSKFDFLDEKVGAKIEKGGEGSGRYPKGSGGEKESNVEYHTGGDALGQEYHGFITAVDKATGKKIGRVDYSYWQGQTEVKMIEVAPEFRRQGHGLNLLNRLQSESKKPIAIQGDFATKEGQALWNRFKNQSNEKVQKAYRDPESYFSDEEIVRRSNEEKFIPKIQDPKKLKEEKDKILLGLSLALSAKAIPAYQTAFKIGQEKAKAELGLGKIKPITEVVHEEEIAPLLDDNDEYLDNLIEDVSEEYEDIMFTKDPYGNITGVRAWDSEEDFDESFDDVMDTQEHRLGIFAVSGIGLASMAGLAYLASELMAGGYWHTHEDDRTCDGCDALDGQWMTFDERESVYQTTECDGNCRCWQLFEPAPAPEGGVEGMLLEAMAHSRMEKLFTLAKSGRPKRVMAEGVKTERKCPNCKVILTDNDINAGTCHNCNAKVTDEDWKNKKIPDVTEEDESLSQKSPKAVKPAIQGATRATENATQNMKPSQPTSNPPTQKPPLSGEPRPKVKSGTQFLEGEQYKPDAKPLIETQEGQNA